MNATKREIRTIDCQLAVRETGEDAQSQSRTITGTAIVFNRESQVLDDWGERFREIILPEAVTMPFLNTQDVKLNLLHERELTIARCNKGAANSSLRMSVDENGVNFEFDAPRCDLGDRALELVRTGVYSGCSFEFYPQDYEKRVEGDEVTIIHHSFAAITALTVGMDPAYVQTSVNVREIVKEECDDKRDDEDEAATPEEEKKDAVEMEEPKTCENSDDDKKECEDTEEAAPWESDEQDDEDGKRELILTHYRRRQQRRNIDEMFNSIF
jgi:HK97 family phage prohead protease